jgi:class 3 adenylate cyclase
MNEGGAKRRLAAILAADVAGYTSLMEQDTDATVAAWQSARANVIDPAIGAHSGRNVKHTGDGFLAEFTTVLDAVRCAIAMQGELAASPLDFRLGINLGDIVDDGEDIHGEGVNIAARLEGLAEPGGICVSGGVHEQVRNQIAAVFEDMGEQRVKHVSAPVRVYRLALDGRATQKPRRLQPGQNEPQDKGSSTNLARELKLGGVLTIFTAPGLVVLGWFVNAVQTMLGVAALVLFVGIGLLVAAIFIERWYGEDEASEPERPPNSV